MEKSDIGKAIFGYFETIIRKIYNRFRLEYIFYLHTRKVINEFRGKKKPVMYDLYYLKDYNPRFSRKDYNELLIRAGYVLKHWKPILNNEDLTKKEKAREYDKLLKRSSKIGIKYIKNDMGSGGNI